MGNEIVVRQEQQNMLAAITPKSYDEVARLSMAVVKSGLYGVKSADDAFVRIITGIELGISPMQALRTIAVVSGKPVMDAALISALCMRHHECVSWRLVESTDKQCTMEAKHARNGITRLTYTIEQAAKAGLVGKDNWKKFPAAMLRARCTSSLARIAFPEVVAGVYVPDELERTAPEQAESVVDATPAAPEPDAAAEIIARISVCDSVAALSAIGQEVRSATLYGDAKARIREAYQQRSKELKAAAKARESAPKGASLPKVGNSVDDWGPEPADGPDGVDAAPAAAADPDQDGR